MRKHRTRNPLPHIASGFRVHVLRTCPGMTSLEPFDRDELAAGGLDAGDRFTDVLDHCRHMMCIGVHDALGIARNSDMALPEQKIAAAQLVGFGRVKRMSERS